MAVGPINLFWGGLHGLLKGAEAGKGRPVLASEGSCDLVWPDVSFCLSSDPRSCSFRKMFSSVAHLARANPFNAPHLQLVYDGLAGPSSSPLGPPGPPRRSRNLAAAAVEGERSTSALIRLLCPLVVRLALMAWRTVRTHPVRCIAGRRPVSCLPDVVSFFHPRPGVRSLSLPQGRGRA